MSLLRVTIDTNITVSALFFGGLPLKVVRAGIEGRFIWVCSPPLFKELETVLASKKFGLKKQDIEDLLNPIAAHVEFVVPSKKLSVITRCPGDNRVLECAVEGNCNFIVTGDRKDLLSLKSFQDIPIVSVRNFLDQI